jgi:hypothetical protein
MKALVMSMADSSSAQQDETATWVREAQGQDPRQDALGRGSVVWVGTRRRLTSGRRRGAHATVLDRVGRGAGRSTMAGVDLQVVVQELDDLAGTVSTIVPDEAERMRVERLIGSVQHMLRTHGIDDRGDCPRCGPARRCPVHEVLGHYASEWWRSATGPIGALGRCP